jgi:hypothetical protein
VVNSDQLALLAMVFGPLLGALASLAHDFWRARQWRRYVDQRCKELDQRCKELDQ